MAITITYTKKAESYDGYGRGIDNYHAPAQWWVIATNGGGVTKKVGFIHSDHVSYMGRPTYTFSFVMEGKPGEVTSIGRAPFPTTSRLRDMKTKINDVERWIGTWFEVAAGAIKRQQEVNINND